MSTTTTPARGLPPPPSTPSRLVEESPPNSATRVTPELEAKLERRRHRLAGNTLDESLDWYYSNKPEGGSEEHEEEEKTTTNDNTSPRRITSGPHSLAHLRDLELRGVLTKTTRVFHKRWMPEWTLLPDAAETLGFRRHKEFDIKRLGIPQSHDKPEWFYANVGPNGVTAPKHSGPVSLTLLVTLLGKGSISSRCLVWRDTMPDWVSIETVLTALQIPFQLPPTTPLKPVVAGTPETAVGVAKAWSVASGQKATPTPAVPLTPRTYEPKVFKPRSPNGVKRNLFPRASDRVVSERSPWGVFAFYVVPLALIAVAHVIWTLLQARWFFFRLPNLLDSSPLSVCSSASGFCVGPTNAAEALTKPTSWSPSGLRGGASWMTSALALPLTKSSRGARVNDARDGFVVTAVAPQFEPGFSVEHEVLPSGSLAFDDSGLLYYSPERQAQDLQKSERISLLALDALTGERRWATLSASTEAGASPLVLNDPDAMDPIQRRVPQWVVHATRSRVTALRSGDGAMVWTTPTDFPNIDVDPNLMGEAPFTAYVAPPFDAIVTVSADGWVGALDRRSGRPVAESKRLPCPPTRSDGTTRCVSSMPAVSPDGTGRIFVVASARDDLDGSTDDRASRLSLYALEWAPGEHDSRLPLRLKVAGSVLVGETLSDVGSPSVSQDGRFVLIGHGEGLVSAYDAFGFDEHRPPIWTVRVEGQGSPSLALASDEELAIYAKTETHVTKLRATYFAAANADKAWVWPVGSVPEQIWSVELYAHSDKYGRLWDLRVSPSTPLLIAGNGALVFGVDLVTNQRPFSWFRDLVVKSGVAVLDRHDGQVRFANLRAPESLDTIAMGHDGSIVGVHSPLKRVKAIKVFGFSAALPPSIGGLSRFQPIAYWALARDAMCAASARAENALKTASGGWITSAPVGGEVAMLLDARQTSALVRQAFVAHQISLERLETKHSVSLTAAINRASDAVGGGVPLLVGLTPKEAANMLSAARSALSEACKALAQVN